MSINIDATEEGADWIKTTYWDLPTDPTEFVDRILHGLDSVAWEHFKTLPSFMAMPADTKRGVEALFGPKVSRAVDARRNSLAR